jgi:hypothetical protein
MDLTIKIAIAGVIVAVLAPLLALELQKLLDERHESRGRKLTIFKNLMMYRVTPLSTHFVQSLNLVDLEFNGKNAKEKAVREKWKVLLDHFNNYSDAKDPVEKAQELTRALLRAMSTCFDYDFDEVYLKRGAYYPKYFVDVEEEQNALRKQLLEVLAGNRRLPVGIFEQRFPDPIDVHTAELPEGRTSKQLAGDIKL